MLHYEYCPYYKKPARQNGPNLTAGRTAVSAPSCPVSRLQSLTARPAVFQPAAAAGPLGPPGPDGAPLRPPAAGPHAQRVRRPRPGRRHLQLRRPQSQQVPVPAALARRVGGVRGQGVRWPVLCWLVLAAQARVDV